MSSDGKIVIDITGDSSGLEKALKDLDTTTKQATERMIKSISGIGNEMDDAGRKTSLFGDILKANLASDAIMSSIKGIASGIANISQTIGGALVDLAKDGIEYNSKMETYTTSFTTMLGSQSEALKLVADLKKTAAETPFGMEGLAQATQTLLGYGVALDDAKTYLSQLGDISQGNSGKLQSLSLAMAQISAAGKLTAQDLNQLISAGWNPLQQVAEKTGKTISELKDDMADGAISVNMVADALKTATSEGGLFFKAMESQSQTFNGQLMTMQDNFSEFKGVLTTGLSDMLAGTALPMVNGWVEEMTTAFETDGVEGLRGAIGNIIPEAVGAITEYAPLIFGAGGDIVFAVLDGVIENAPNIIRGANEMVSKFLDEMQDKTDFVHLGHGIVEAIADGIIENAPKLTEILSDVTRGGVYGALDSINELGVNIADAIFGEAEPSAFEKKWATYAEPIRDEFKKLQKQVAEDGIEVSQELLNSIEHLSARFTSLSPAQRKKLQTEMQELREILVAEAAETATTAEEAGNGMTMGWAKGMRPDSMVESVAKTFKALKDEIEDKIALDKISLEDGVAELEAALSQFEPDSAAYYAAMVEIQKIIEKGMSDAEKTALEGSRNIRQAISDALYLDDITGTSAIAQLNEHLKTLDAGSKEYTETRKAIKKLEDDIAKDEERAAKQRTATAQSSSKARVDAEKEAAAALKKVLTDAEKDISNLASLDLISTFEQLTRYRELLKEITEGTDEHMSVRIKIHNLEKKIAEEAAKEVRDRYSEEKQEIADKVYFEEMAVDMQLEAWGSLKTNYAEYADFVREIDKNIFDLKKQQAENAKKADQTATDDYIKNMDYELQFTEKSEKDKLIYKMNAIQKEIAERKKAGLEYAALEEKYNDYSRDLALELHNEEKRQRQEEYNADLEVFKKKTALKERDYADEIKYLATLAEEYKNDAELKKALAQEVYNYKAALTEQLANLEDQQAQRALQLFEQLMPSAAKFDLESEYKKIEEQTKKNIETSKSLSDTQADYNYNLLKSANISDKIAGLNEQLAEADEKRRIAYERLQELLTFDPYRVNNTNEIKAAEVDLNLAIEEQASIEKELAEASKEEGAASKERNDLKKDLRDTTDKLLEQYPQLLEYYDKETGGLKLTKEEIQALIAEYKNLEKERARKKPQEDLLKSAKDQNKALDDYAAGMKKLENMELDSMAFEKFKKDGVSALDTINAILAMTPEQFNEYNKALSEIADKTARMAEEEFAADIEKTKEALSGITTVITEYAESDELKESSKQIGTSMIDGEIEGIQEKQEELTTAATDAIQQAVETMENIVNGDLFTSIGKNMIQRIIDGFNSMVSTLTETIQTAMGSLAPSAMQTLQIQSPSKLFRDKIGKNIALGVGAGIKDEMPTVEATLSRHMKMLTNVINQTMTLRPTASDVLSSVNRSSMADMADIKHMLQAQINNVNQQQAVTPNINVVMESTGSARDVFEALSIGIKRVDYLNGGAKA